MIQSLFCELLGFCWPQAWTLLAQGHFGDFFLDANWFASRMPSSLRDYIPFHFTFQTFHTAVVVICHHRQIFANIIHEQIKNGNAATIN